MRNIITDIQFKLNDIDHVVAIVWPYLQRHSIISFAGEMGAGKTTFIHALCHYLKVPDAVSSPTFALINEYHFTDNGNDRTIYHMDWYRLKDAEEAVNAGIEDSIQTARSSNNYCFIEWAEKAPEILPHQYMTVSITFINEQERKIVLSEHNR